MNLIIQKASSTDADELLGLYLGLYGENYPLEIGTRRKTMLKALLDPERFLWLVMRDQDKGIIAGSMIFEIDPWFRIGKVTGAAVNKKYQGYGVATRLIAYGVDIVLHEKKLVNSLYATARTASLGSQMMLIRNGFKPLGIFPNARKINSYETLALLGLFNKGILEERASVDKIPANLEPISKIVSDVVGSGINFSKVETGPPVGVEDSDEEGEDFEFIFAPHFVEKRFDECFSHDEESVFYPFHRPNMIIASEQSNLEIYASFSKKDHYCVWITANENISSHRGQFKKLMFALKEQGIYYVETLVRADYFDTICFLTENRFIPSAIYPAMRQQEGLMHDYVLLTRTMVPLDFSNATVHESFRPYINQYAKQWLHMNLSIVEGIE